MLKDWCNKQRKEEFKKTGGILSEYERQKIFAENGSRVVGISDPVSVLRCECFAHSHAHRLPHGLHFEVT